MSGVLSKGVEGSGEAAGAAAKKVTEGAKSLVGGLSGLIPGKKASTNQDAEAEEDAETQEP